MKSEELMEFKIDWRKTVSELGDYNSLSELEAKQYCLEIRSYLKNHPLDCNVCYKSGECKLQNFCYEYCKDLDDDYTSKKGKRKYVNIGKDIFFDEQKCIGCGSCVTFLKKQLNKENMSLKMIGNRTVIDPHTKLDSEYSSNLECICPVGALMHESAKDTPKSWMLKKTNTICLGCSKICDIEVLTDKDKIYRIRQSTENSSSRLICDDGKNITNCFKETRVKEIQMNVNGKYVPAEFENINSFFSKGVYKFVLNSFFTNEEYLDFFEIAKLFEVSIYQFPNVGKEFDGILKRGDKNPNKTGAQKIFLKNSKEYSETSLNKFIHTLSLKDHLFIAIPEIIPDKHYFEHFLSRLKNKTRSLNVFSANMNLNFGTKFDYIFPLPSFFEKNGTITNFESATKKLHSTNVSNSLSEKNISYYLKTLMDVKA